MMKIISCDHYCEKLWGKNNNMARKNIKNITHLWTLLLAVLCSVCPQHIDYILVIMKDLQSIGTSQNKTNLELGLATPYFGNAYKLQGVPKKMFPCLRGHNSPKNGTRNKSRVIFKILSKGPLQKKKKKLWQMSYRVCPPPPPLIWRKIQCIFFKKLDQY